MLAVYDTRLKKYRGKKSAGIVLLTHSTQAL